MNSRLVGPDGRVAAPMPAAGNPNLPATQHQDHTGIPYLPSTYVNNAGATDIPWTQLTIQLYKFVQPTGVTPGTYAGLTIDASGRVVSAQTSGFTLDNPQLTGTPTAPTPPANDNSTRIATTAFVDTAIHSQGFITGVSLAGDVTGAGASGIPTEVVALQGHALSVAAPPAGTVLYFTGTAWVPLAPPWLTDAPHDGNLYARQNGNWVRLAIDVIPPT
jgi:hypothetical protein